MELPSLHGLSGHPRVPPECTVVFSSPTLWSSRVSVRVAHQPGLLLLMCLPSAHHFFPRASRRCVLLCRRVKGFFLSMPVKGFHFFPPLGVRVKGFLFFPPLGAREGYFLSFFFLWRQLACFFGSVVCAVSLASPGSACRSIDVVLSPRVHSGRRPKPRQARDGHSWRMAAALLVLPAGPSSRLPTLTGGVWQAGVRLSGLSPVKAPRTPGCGSWGFP